ncbi:MAG: hypothetical protein ACREN5_15700 [Gemmatimonadales bacterium]
MQKSIRRALALAAVVAAGFATPALAGPPWISIELPANPYDASTRGAFLLVHAFHHGTPVGFPITGTAEGIVNGERRTVRLEFTKTSRDGVYGLRKMWPEEGTWTLVISVNQGGDDRDDKATAVVELDANGAVAAVKVPTRQQGQWTIPAGVSMADVDAGLRARAGALAKN